MPLYRLDYETNVYFIVVVPLSSSYFYDPASLEDAHPNLFYDHRLAGKLINSLVVGAPKSGSYGVEDALKGLAGVKSVNEIIPMPLPDGKSFDEL